jgi:hypothetical protein
MALYREVFRLKFEFSSRRTPLRNGEIERKFQTLYGSVRSILNHVGIKDKMRRSIWVECASTVRYYANILVNRESGKPPQESMFGVKFKKLTNLKIFGETVVVTIRKKIQGKFSDRGTVCIFVGCRQNHSNDM